MSATARSTLLVLALCAAPAAAQLVFQPRFEDEYISPERAKASLDAAIAAGQIAQRSVIGGGPLAPVSNAPGNPSCVTPPQIFAFEDTNQVLLTNFSDGELINLMADAANAVIAQHGDEFDFIGYFVNFVPDHTIGAAFYLGIFNDVQGIGLSIGDSRANLGLNTNHLHGWVMMWDVNSGNWAPGAGAGAAFTRLALAQEFEHRFAMFLPSLLDGRVLQGDNASCGRSFHWSWRVDGQGSGMEISEWIGSSPAELVGNFVTFNTDIPGGVFSYTDLYLMGYVSPAEMDAGNSELRFMDNSFCSQFYSGTISTFSSADIIASAGARVPDSTAAQKHFRTAWVMIHRPGDPPSAAELNKAVGILNQHTADWNLSTLGRGTMDNSRFDDCNCNAIPDAQDIAGGGSLDVNGNGVPDECENICIADVTTQGASTGGPGFGVPDGLVTASDINYYVNAWVAGDVGIADLTTQGAGAGDSGFGTPDGLVTASDINFYVNLWVVGCP